jgi:hypothetical protein
VTYEDRQRTYADPFEVFRNMTFESSDIDRLLDEYVAAVDQWIDTIRREVELASTTSAGLLP